MSNSRQARVIRTAISPRLAIRMRLNMRSQARGNSKRIFFSFPLLPFLEWNIAMLLGWIVILLVLEHFQGTNKCRTSIFRIDHGIDIAGFRRLEWVGKGLAVLLNHLIAGCGGIFGFLERVAKDDTDGALRTHDCNLSGWIGQ